MDDEVVLVVIAEVADASSFFGLFCCRLCVELLEFELSESELYFRLLVACFSLLSRFVIEVRSSAEVIRGAAAPNEGDRMLSIENLRLLWCSCCR